MLLLAFDGQPHWKSAAEWPIRVSRATRGRFGTIRQPDRAVSASRQFQQAAGSNIGCDVNSCWFKPMSLTNRIRLCTACSFSSRLMWRWQAVHPPPAPQAFATPRTVCRSCSAMASRTAHSEMLRQWHSGRVPSVGHCSTRVCGSQSSMRRVPAGRSTRQDSRKAGVEIQSQLDARFLCLRLPKSTRLP